MSLKNGVVLGVSPVQVSETLVDLNVSTTVFLCGLKILWFHSLSSSSPYIHPSVTDRNLELG